MKPPLLARALLFAMAGEAEAECVTGDLDEEFAFLSGSRARFAANRWYVSQVMRSILPLLQLRIRSGELGRIVLGAIFGVSLPLLVLDRLWRLVYSEIPLKDGLDRAPEFLAINLLALGLCSAISGLAARSIRLAASTALAAIAAAGVAMWGSTGSTPAAYALLVLLVAPLSSIVAYVVRLRRTL